jgi:hypothetical protein
MKNHIAPAAGIIGIISAVFAAYLYLEKIHINVEEAELSALKAHQRILMSESTRYGEVAKYYHDLQKERDLTLAEMDRLRLVERQQERIAKDLLESMGN